MHSKKKREKWKHGEKKKTWSLIHLVSLKSDNKWNLSVWLVSYTNTRHLLNPWPHLPPCSYKGRNCYLSLISYPRSLTSLGHDRQETKFPRTKPTHWVFFFFNDQNILHSFLGQGIIDQPTKLTSRILYHNLCRVLSELSR